MAAITSALGAGVTAPIRSWNTTTTWQGGVIPGAADDVTISGYRTTINQSAISKWLIASPITITVASTANFPTSSSYFWTGTDRGEPVRINYTGVSGNSFTGCTIDTSDPNYPWDLGGSIANGQYVLSPAPIIKMVNTESWTINSLTIQNGGFFQMDPGTTLRANAFITIRDGWFVGRASTASTSTVIVARPEAQGLGYFQTENFPMSILDIDGSETRTWGTLTNSIAIGGVTATVSISTGSFAIGDEVAVYDPRVTANRRRNFSVFRDVVNNYAGMDEGFDVCGVSGSNVYLSRRNGARGTIKNVTNFGSQQILTVDKNDHQGQLSFKAGDTIVVNNNVYVINSVAKSEYPLASYNFQTGSTLADFLTDYAYETGWAIDQYGAYFTSSSSTHGALAQKFLWRREMIVECEVSPLNQYSTGTRATQGFGLLMSYDPSTRQGARGWYDQAKMGFWKIDDGADRIYFSEHMTGEYDDFHQLSLDTSADTPAIVGGLRNQLRGPNLLRVETRDHQMKFSVNGEQIGERFSMNALPGGLWGYHSISNNTNARIKSLTYKAPTQDLYITAAAAFNSGDIVYEAGAELAHAAGRTIVKIASKITGVGTHDDFAFAYRASYNPDGAYPLCVNVNGSANAGGGWITNHDMIRDYWLDVGTSASPLYVTLDLGQQRTFTHVSFQPRIDEMGTDPGMVAVQIYGSNDNSTFTSIYGPTTDTKKYVGGGTGGWYNQMGHYAVGTQTYRYVRFSTTGHDGTANTTINRYLNIGVHNFTAGFTIVVNNASDFRVGDVISVMCHSQETGNVEDLHQYNTVKAGGNADTKYWTPFTHRTITNKVGNTLFLDAPINWGFIEGGETVVKVNKQFVMRGFYSKDGGTLWQKPYFVTNSGTNTPRIHWLKNVYWVDVGSSRLGGNNWFRGVNFWSQDYNNNNIVDGCSLEGYNNSGANGFTTTNAGTTWRNNYIANVHEFRPYYLNSYQGVAIFNNKIHQIANLRAESQINSPFNYNEACGMNSFLGYQALVVDAYTTGAMQREWRRNVMHGWREISGYYDNNINGGGVICPIFVIEYNRYYATNYMIYQIRNPHDLDFPVGSDVACRHPGQRVTQYRNVGWTGWWSSNDWGQPYGGSKDLGRAGYDMTVAGLYHHTIRPEGADYLRIYANTADGQLPLASIRGYVKVATPFQVYVEFEYRQPMRYNRTQNGNWDNGRFRVGALQNGVYVSGYPQYTPLPTSDAWQRYVNTVTTFVSTAGQFAVWIGRADDSSFIDVRNMRAYVITNTSTNVTVLLNNFDTSKYFDPSGDKRFIQPAAPTASNRFKTIKL